MFKWLDKLEYAGWGFLGVSFLLFAGPGVWVVWRFTYAGTEAATRVGMGLFLGAITAAVFTFIVNDLLHRRNLRRHRAREAGQSNRTSRTPKQ